MAPPTKRHLLEIAVRVAKGETHGGNFPISPLIGGVDGIPNFIEQTAAQIEASHAKETGKREAKR